MLHKKILLPNKGYLYYCYICLKEYQIIEVFTPIEGCSDYFNCKKCNNTYIASQIKLRRKYIDYCNIF